MMIPLPPRARLPPDHHGVETELTGERKAREDGSGQAAGTLSRGLYWAPAISIFLTLYCTLRQLALQLLEAQVLAA